MAAGRGEFFRSLLEGLERLPPGPAGGGRQPARGGGKPGPARGRGKKRRPPKTAPSPAPSPVSVWAHRNTKSVMRTKASYFPPIPGPPCQESYLEKLPSEIVFKILSYLDVSSLFCVSQVSKRLQQLADNEFVWYQFYVAEFGSQMWKPKLVNDAAMKKGPVEEEDLSGGHWRKMFFRAIGVQEVNKWRRELRDLSPHTGLPRQTEWVLRNLNVTWELTLYDHMGKECRLELTRAHYFESSVIIRWSGSSFIKYHHISSVRLHGVRKEGPRSPRVRSPTWRSLILKLDMKTQPGHLMGKDKLIRLMHLCPGVIIGVWRGQNSVAFIMVSLHFHKLVERSLLGSPAGPYYDPVVRPPVDKWDPEFGLHGYTLHFVLHNTSSEIMSSLFRHLSCRPAQIQCGLVELKVIERTELSQHRLLSGHVRMPWKSETLEGSVENCCVMSLTLLDESQKPFWCVSSPVCVSRAERSASYDYSGEYFVMASRHPDGQVKMKLVWLKEQKQFFLVSLTVYISVLKVNEHFGRCH